MTDKPQPFPHDELAALDKRNVARLLEINAEFQRFYRKHPFFETDPTCRLARELCIQHYIYRPADNPEFALAEAEQHADRLCINGGHELRAPVPVPVNLGPKADPNAAIPATFPDFLISGNRPRPLWTAWIPQAEAALAALKSIEDKNG